MLHRITVSLFSLLLVGALGIDGAQASSAETRCVTVAGTFTVCRDV